MSGVFSINIINGDNLKISPANIFSSPCWNCIFCICSTVVAFVSSVNKTLLIKYSYAFIVMPGGFGTLDEFFEALTLMQTHKTIPMPLILFGTDFWGGLLDWIKNHMLRLGTITQNDLDLVTLTDDPQQVLAIMLQHQERLNCLLTL